MIRYEKKNLIDGRIDGGCPLQGMAQQITPKDVAGDKEYNRVCREYELRRGTAWSCYRLIWTNILIPAIKRVLSLIASAYFMEGNRGRPLPCSGLCDPGGFA